MTARTWSPRLAEELAAQVADRTRLVAVPLIRPVSDDVLEVVFAHPGERDQRGLRLERRVVDAATGRWRQATLGEIAFDVVTMFINEPRRIEEFRAADPAGVRWLPLSDWLEDIFA